MVSSAGAGSGVLPEGDDEFASESNIESAAAACVLWSTVGVGCLIGGRPKSSVSRLLDCCRWRIRPTLIAVVGGLLSRQYDGGRRGCCLWDDTLLSCVGCRTVDRFLLYSPPKNSQYYLVRRRACHPCLASVDTGDSGQTWDCSSCIPERMGNGGAWSMKSIASTPLHVVTHRSFPSVQRAIGVVFYSPCVFCGGDVRCTSMGFEQRPFSFDCPRLGYSNAPSRRNPLPGCLRLP